MIFRNLIMSSLLAGVASPAVSHEFWLEPEVYQAETGEKIGIPVFNGQDFKGTELSWFDNRIDRVTIHNGEETQEYKGLPGDLPAITVTAQDGMTTVSYASTMSRLTYDSWEKTLLFAGEKGLTWFQNAHSERGLPQENVTEGYWRFSKTLVAGGVGSGSDTDTGLKTEFVMQTNPFADTADNVSAILLYQGEPRRDAQVELWDKFDGEVTRTIYRTNDQGIVTLPVEAGHSYQIDAVVLREPESDAAIKAGVMWESLWANMTFGIPE